MSHGTPNSCEAASTSKKGIDCTVHSKILDHLGSYVILKAEIKDKMYVQTANKETDIVNYFLNNLRMILKNEKSDYEDNIIIGGDFNCQLNPVFDKNGGTLLP